MDKEKAASQYAEQNGISRYKVKGNRMIYYETDKTSTTKVTVRLNTLAVERQKLTKRREDYEIFCNRN